MMQRTGLFFVRLSIATLTAASSLAFGTPATAERTELQRLVGLLEGGNCDQATRELQSGVKSGSSAHQVAWGVALMDGLCTSADTGAALDVLRLAGQQGHLRGKALFASTVIADNAPASDIARAVTWARESAQAGDSLGQHLFGGVLLQGQLVKQDVAAAVLWLRKAAAQGNDDATAGLASMFLTGQFVAKDPVEGRRLAETSAKSGSSKGQTLLCAIHSDGIGQPKNPTAALEWCRKSADQGEVGGMVILGHLLAFGPVATANSSEALKWLTKASDLGSAPAKARLGLMYFGGIGVPADLKKAAGLFQVAATAGDVSGMANLGQMHLMGIGGVRQDYIEARRLLEKGAQSGMNSAARNLGAALGAAPRSREDLVQAYAWLVISSSTSDISQFEVFPPGQPKPIPVEQVRDAMRDKLTKAEIERGQQLARQWQPGRGLGEPVSPVSKR